jgi:hypothetical protein
VHTPFPTVEEQSKGLQKSVVVQEPVPQGTQPSEVSTLEQTPPLQVSVVQLFPSSQLIGVFTQAPVEVLQAAVVQELGATQGIGVNLHCPDDAVQESEVHGLLSLQVTLAGKPQAGPPVELT